LRTPLYSTTSDISAVVEAQIGAVSLQAVYDGLATLTEKGIIRRIEPAGSPARYEDRVGDSHHHLICRTCHRMFDVDSAVGQARCVAGAEDSGYEIDADEVISRGRCPDCLVAAAPHPAGDRMPYGGTSALRLIGMRRASAARDRHRDRTVSE